MNPLRNSNINYCQGWFFVTIQVAMNKSIFGVVSDKRLILNALGEAIKQNLSQLGNIFPELYIDAFVVMPNHLHAVIKIDSHNKSRDLSYFLGRFKSFTANLYHRMVRENACVDIGASLWQNNYYDNLITEHSELEAIREYIKRNPERWEDDRFGPVTTYSKGNLELLNESLVAFVASDTKDNWQEDVPHLREVREVSGRSPISKEAPLISTFSSFEEKGALAKRIKDRLPFIWVDPAGIKSNLRSDVATAIREGWGLVISPVESGTGLNKQRAIWCNRWIIKVAKRIYVGTIKKGGTLDTLLTHGGVNLR